MTPSSVRLLVTLIVRIAFSFEAGAGVMPATHRLYERDARESTAPRFRDVRASASSAASRHRRRQTPDTAARQDGLGRRCSARLPPPHAMMNAFGIHVPLRARGAVPTRVRHHGSALGGPTVTSVLPVARDTGDAGATSTQHRAERTSAVDTLPRTN